MHRRRLVVTALACLTAGVAVAATREEGEARAAELVARMTLEEKAVSCCYAQPAIPRLGIPAYNWWNEALHGVARAGLATVFPQAIGRAATFDADLEERIGRAVATEARAKYNLFAAKGFRARYCGVNLLSPNVNMFRDPRWGRGQETYGEDPFLTGRMGGAYVRGIQARENGLMKACACAKHFAVHSGPENGRFRFSVDVPERDVREYYLPAFRMLVEEAGVETVMTSYNALNGTPMTANAHMIADILRGEWGFAGCVVSDAGATDFVSHGHRLADEVESAARVEEAGLDLGIDFALTNLVRAVRTGRIPESDLDRHLVRLFSLRMRLGLLTADGHDAFADLGEKDVATEAHRALVLECAEKSIVLVANRNAALPLRKSATRALAVVGPRALDAVPLYGNYNGHGARASCVLNGFAEEGGAGIALRTGDGWRTEFDTPVDACIVCLGITPEVEGEGEDGDRKDYGLEAGQLDLLKNVKAAASGPVVAVIFGGSPVDLRPVCELADAVLLVWYPGEEGGRAIARVVFGEVNPSGRLPVSFPMSYDDLPPFESYAVEGRTYRYARKPFFRPFGFGLSYTTFAYAPAVRDGNRVSAEVANSGPYDGDEVVQAYALPAEGSASRLQRRLVGFRRVRLCAGERRTVSFELKDVSANERVVVCGGLTPERF